MRNSSGQRFTFESATRREKILFNWHISVEIKLKVESLKHLQQFITAYAGSGILRLILKWLLAYCKYFKKSNVHFELRLDVMMIILHSVSCTIMCTFARARLCSLSRSYSHLLMFTLKWHIHIPYATSSTSTHGCDHIFTFVHIHIIACLFTVNKRNAVHHNLQKYLHELLMFVSMFESIIRKFHHSNMILRLRCTSFLPTIRIYETYLLIFIVFISPLDVYNKEKNTWNYKKCRLEFS